MIGRRLKKANQIAKKRYKRFLWWWDEKPSEKNIHLIHQYRKTNVQCSCEMCRNPRHCSFTPKKERPTVQERKAPTVEEFELPETLPEIWCDLDDEYENQYWEDVEWFMVLDLIKEEDNLL